MNKKVLIGAKNGSLARYSEILTKAGYSVISAESEAELFSQYRNSPFEVILFDLNMGLKHLPKLTTGRTPVIALSNEAGYRGFTKNIGVHDFVQTPIAKAKDLEQAVQSAIESKEEAVV